jgi:hypothetical protein
MKLELKKLNKPDGKVWYAVLVNGSYESPFYYTEDEAREHYNRIIEQSKLNKPAEETLLSEEI